MDEEQKTESQAYRDFLTTVEMYGAHCTIWDEDKKGKKALYIRPKSKPGKGPEDHFITDDNLIDFRAMTRRERRHYFPKKVA